MSANRSAGRNVNFYDRSSGRHLGGVVQNGSITNANFFNMLMDVLLDVNEIVTIWYRGTEEKMPLNTDPLVVADYDISVPAGEQIRMNEEPFIRRVFSRSRNRREESFQHSVRNRDCKCVILGIPVLPGAGWEGFEVEHIFPLQCQSLWDRCSFDSVIAQPVQSSINSVQNGILLSASMHQLFDSYHIAINPDDGYKITNFRRDSWKVDGRILDPVCRDPNDPDHVADALIRWHFRQSVLANMRGAGEATFEHDFPSGTDMIQEIMEGPLAAERMELELSARLL